jgi:hypothetical protein
MLSFFHEAQRDEVSRLTLPEKSSPGEKKTENRLASSFLRLVDLSLGQILDFYTLPTLRKVSKKGKIVR